MKKLLVTTISTALAFCLFACSPSGNASETATGDSPSTSHAAFWAQLDGIVENGQPLSEEDKAALSGTHASFTDEPQQVLQYPEFESGCEIAALTAALQSMGFDVDMSEIVDKHLVVDGEYATGYLASPRTDYGGGFPPGVADAANSYLASQGSTLTARDLTGSSFGGITALVEAGYPVLVWTTLEQTDPNFDPELGAIEDWYVNEHCVTVYRIDGASGTVTASDPLKGIVKLDVATFAEVYAKCGSRALVIR